MISLLSLMLRPNPGVPSLSLHWLRRQTLRSLRLLPAMCTLTSLVHLLRLLGLCSLVLGSILLLESLPECGRRGCRGHLFPCCSASPPAPGALLPGETLQLSFGLPWLPQAVLLLHCPRKALQLRVALPRPCLTMQLESAAAWLFASGRMLGGQSVSPWNGRCRSAGCQTF